MAQHTAPDVVVDLLVLFAPKISADDPAHTRNLVDAAARRLDALDIHGGQLWAVVFVGELTRTGSSADFVELEKLSEGISTLLISRDAHELPPLLAAPGLTDHEPLPPSTAASRALEQWWDTTRTGLWTGEYHDVVDSVGQGHAAFATWNADHEAGLLDLRHGALPGEATGFLDPQHRVRCVLLNTGFRPSADDCSFLLQDAQVDELIGAAPGPVDQVVAQIVVSAAPLDGRRLSTAPAVVLFRGGVQVQAGGWLIIHHHEPGGEDPALVRVTVSPTRAAVAVNGVDCSSGQSSSSPAEPSALLPPAGERSVQEIDREFDECLAEKAPVLILISGIESSASNSGGQPLVSASKLTRQLLPSMAGGDFGDNLPVLDEVLRASGLSQRQVDNLTTASFRAVLEPAARNPIVHQLLRAPWARIYDFTGTNILPSLVDADPDLRAEVQLVNAHVDAPTAMSGRLQIVSMCGVAGRVDAPVTFALPAPGGTTKRDRWFAELQTDLLLAPAIILSDDHAASALPSVLNLLYADGLVYPRFAVVPNVARLGWRLRPLQVQSIDSEPAAFIRDRLAPSREVVSRGRQRLARRRVRVQRGVGVQIVQALLDDAPTGSENFLRGNEPTWGDVRSQIAAPLSRLDTIVNEIDEARAATGREPQVLLTGKAGSGKSTALMQLALRLNGGRRVVGWVDRAATHAVKSIVEKSRELDLEAVLVDDVDIFGGQAAALMRDLNRGGRVLVVGTVRTTRSELLETAYGLTTVRVMDDPLTDDDLGHLLNTLSTNRLLGSLRSIHPEQARRRKLGELSERDLLTGMVSVVEGEPFDRKIASEYDDLPPLQASLYAAISVLVSNRFEAKELPMADLIQMMGSLADQPTAHRALQALIAKKLVVDTGNQAVRGRHRAIADRVTAHLRKHSNTLAAIIEMLLQHYATRAYQIRDSTNPYRRMMISLLSHSAMRDSGLPPSSVREIYKSVHHLLENDFHYWLQCGRYESERGNDLDQAATFLEAALHCDGGNDDFMVRTAWAEVCLQRSAATPDSSKLLANAMAAMAELRAVYKVKGSKSPHTFVVLAKEGYKWLKSATQLTPNERTEILTELLDQDLDIGKKICDNPEFVRTVRKYEPLLQQLRTPRAGIPL